MIQVDADRDLAYRYEDQRTIGGSCIVLRTYSVEKHTPCGFWIDEGWVIGSGRQTPNGWRFVRKNAKKQFAFSLMGHI